KIIAIIGLPGSGKTEAIKYLMKKFNWPKVYFGDMTFNEMKKRGLAANQKNEKLARESLRKKFGMAAYAIKSLPLIKREMKNSDIVLIESMYSWEEYLKLKKQFNENLIVIAIYAPPELRYQRLEKRLNERPLKQKEAKERDHAQIENLRQAGPIAMANHTIINDSSEKELYRQLDNIIKKIQ
ncbi:hypothetical protein A2Y83_02490, partial [Candidatus Falkowbacteria bacterium RBG_13_39_14]